MTVKQLQTLLSRIPFMENAEINVDSEHDEGITLECFGKLPQEQFDIMIKNGWEYHNNGHMDWFTIEAWDTDVWENEKEE